LLPTKIVALGAGSDAFGLTTLATLLRSERLKGSSLALVDTNAETLALVEALAQRMNREWDAGMTITAHTRHEDALEGAGFVILSIEVTPREELWKSDWEIPLKRGVRQPYAENGGPGGFAHAARNIQPIMHIVHDMEAACPDALLINFTNPMQRICDAVSRYSDIRCVGLCHQIMVSYAVVGLVLADEPTASLDTERAYQVVETFAGLIHEQKRAGIMVTHDLRMCEYVDRVLQMRDGKLVQIYATRDEIMELVKGRHD